MLNKNAMRKLWSLSNEFSFTNVYKNYIAGQFGSIVCNIVYKKVNGYRVCKNNLCDCANIPGCYNTITVTSQLRVCLFACSIYSNEKPIYRPTCDVFKFV